MQNPEAPIYNKAAPFIGHVNVLLTQHDSNKRGHNADI